MFYNVDKFTKAFGVFHWDTFDDETLLIDEFDSLDKAQQFVQERYKGRLGSGDGADRVDIVNQQGDIVDYYSTR